MKRNAWFSMAVLLAVIGVLPSSLTVFLDATSMAQGVAVSIVLTVVLALKKLPTISFSPSELLVVFLVFLFIPVHSYISPYEIDAGRLGKYIFSLPYLLVLLFSASVLYNLASRYSDNDFKISAFIVFYLLTIILVIKALSMSLAGHGVGKAMYLFKEPSHFSLVYSIFFSYYIIAEGRFRVVLYLIVALCALIIKSMVLMCVLALALLMIKKRRKAVVGLVVFALFPILAYMVFWSNVEGVQYFAERLHISSDSENLSVLVFLSGYERSIVALSESNYLGAGFQSMGGLGIIAPLQIEISKIAGSYLNLEDGGTLSAKIFFEFGIFGALLVTCYLLGFFYYVAKGFDGRREFEKFFLVSFLTISLSLFVRGVGYFSPSTFLALCFVMGGIKKLKLVSSLGSKVPDSSRLRISNN